MIAQEHCTTDVYAHDPGGVVIPKQRHDGYEAQISASKVEKECSISASHSTPKDSEVAREVRQKVHAEVKELAYPKHTTNGAAVLTRRNPRANVAREGP